MTKIDPKSHPDGILASHRDRTALSQNRELLTQGQVFQKQITARAKESTGQNE